MVGSDIFWLVLQNPKKLALFLETHNGLHMLYAGIHFQTCRFCYD